jgi:hypothetical protein
MASIHLPHGPYKRPRRQRLHPLVYKGTVALVLWMVLAAWGFLGLHGYSALALTVVTMLASVALILPLSLWHLGRRGQPDKAARRSLGEWLKGDLEIWQGRLPAKLALVDILTIPAAAALGMTALAVVFYFASHAT